MPRSRRMRTARRRKSRSYRRRLKRRRTRAPRRTGGWRNPLRHELKFLDSASAGTLGKSASECTVADNPAIVCLNAPVQGSGATQRIGRQIMIRKILGRVKFFNRTAPTGSAFESWAPTVRWMLVYDMQTNGTAPTQAQLFSAPADISTLQNLDNRDRFKILMDKVFTFAKIGMRQVDEGQATAGQAKTYKFYKRVNLPVQFNAGNAGTVADIATGSLHLVCFSDGGSNDPTYNAHIDALIRIRYSDM